MRRWTFLFSFGLHAVLLGTLLAFPGVDDDRETVYRVSLAEFSSTEGAARGPESDGAASAVAQAPQPATLPAASSESVARPAEPIPQTAPPEPRPEPVPPKEPPKPAPDPVSAAPKPAPAEKPKTPKRPSPKQVRRATPVSLKPGETPSPGKETGAPPAAGGVKTSQGGSPGGVGENAGAGIRQLGGFDAHDADRVDQKPSVLRRSAPEYPARAKRLHVEGTVVVELVIDTSGRPQACVVHTAEPAGYFEEAALAATRKMRFRPGMIQGRAVNTLVRLPFVFRLKP